MLKDCSSNVETPKIWWIKGMVFDFGQEMAVENWISWQTFENT